MTSHRHPFLLLFLLAAPVVLHAQSPIYWEELRLRQGIVAGPTDDAPAAPIEEVVMTVPDVTFMIDPLFREVSISGRLSLDGRRFERAFLVIGSPHVEQVATQVGTRAIPVAGLDARVIVPIDSTGRFSVTARVDSPLERLILLVPRDPAESTLAPLAGRVYAIGRLVYGDGRSSATDQSP